MDEDISMDEDIYSMDANELLAEVIRLRTAIRTHRDAKGHDRCWRDDVEVLYSCLPEATEADLTLPPREEFLHNCELYWKLRGKQE